VPDERWRTHVIIRHPELKDQEDLVKQAIEKPASVIEKPGQPDDRFFVGETIAGSGFNLGGKRVVAVVNYTGGSKFETAYATTLPPKGNVIWKRP
jgi:hypothetical protein